jgi:hypothetical protein
MPELFVALQANSPRFMGNRLANAQKFSLFFLHQLNFYLCNGTSVNSFFSKRSYQALRA